MIPTLNPLPALPSYPAYLADKAELLALLKTHSFKTGHFTLASGKTSSFYLDCRMTTLHGRGSYLIGRLLAPLVQQLNADAVGGMSMGADPLVSAITVRSADLGHVLNGFLVRKATKAHGTGRQIEGHLAPWMRIVLVEDVVTTGTSTLQAIEAVRRYAPQVTIAGVLALVNRHEGGAEAFAQQGVPMQALFDIDQFLEAVDAG
jgi:orotate phosphoribosyltransferase